VVDEVAAHFGGLDIVVNNAGISIGAPIDHEKHEEMWQLGLDVMLSAHVRIVRRALPHLERSGDGRVINIASTEGLGATAMISPYTVPKHGVIGLTRSLACELGRRGITVNCICPGPIATGMTQGIPDEAKEKFVRRRVPVRRYGKPEEIAHMVLSLALPGASFVNGAVLPVDGGLHISFG